MVSDFLDGHMLVVSLSNSVTYLAQTLRDFPYRHVGPQAALVKMPSPVQLFFSSILLKQKTMYACNSTKNGQQTDD